MPFRSSARKHSTRRVRAPRRSRARVPARTSQVARVYRRPRARRASRPVTARWSNPMALARNVKFHYADSGFPLTTGIAGAVTSIAHASGCYDPYITGVGVQPYEWDTLMSTATYNRYIVYGCKITARFYFTGAPNTVICSVLFSPLAAVTYKGTDDLRVNPNCRQVTMNEVSKGTATITMYRPIQSITHRDPSEFIAPFTANPSFTGLAYMHIFADSSNMAAPVAVGVDVDIIYYCRIVRDDTANES